MRSSSAPVLYAFFLVMRRESCPLRPRQRTHSQATFADSYTRSSGTGGGLNGHAGGYGYGESANGAAVNGWEAAGHDSGSASGG